MAAVRDPASHSDGVRRASPHAPIVDRGAVELDVAILQGSLDPGTRRSCSRSKRRYAAAGGRVAIRRTREPSGEWARAEQQLRDAVNIYRRVKGASGESLSLQRLGVLLTARGKVDEGLAVLAEAGFAAERALMRSHCMTRVHASTARNRLATRDLDAAASSLAGGLDMASRYGNCLTCNALLLPEAVRVRISLRDLAGAESAATSSRP